MKFDVCYGLNKAIKPLIRIVEQVLSWNDYLPLTVPHGTSNKTVAGKLRPAQAARVSIEAGAEYQGGRDRPERLMFADGKERLSQGVC